MTDVFAAFRFTDVAFDDDFILLTLADGRRTRQPLRWAPALFEATPEQRAQWVATANGLGVNWPALLPPREDGVVDVPNQVWDDRYEAALARLKAAAWALDALSDEDQQLVALSCATGVTLPASWRCVRCRRWARCRPTRSWPACAGCWTGWKTTRQSHSCTTCMAR
ncbi:hypothetical protein G6F57_017167 [Rhizopus arrhizus]|nr:hypothetical protein G6F57_017167 [Rhizopus arrhizus]